jgi:ADP-ribose pyrophosphatase
MRQQVFRGRIVDLGIERAVLPNGVEVELEIVRHVGASAVAAVDDDGCVVLIRQYRHAAGEYLWEIPAGLLNPGESPEACAQRELAEEVGLTARTLRPLGTMLPTPGYSDERIHLFLGLDVEAARMAHERDEVIERIERIPLDEALRMVHQGGVPDAKTALGLHLAAAALTEES